MVSQPWRALRRLFIHFWCCKYITLWPVNNIFVYVCAFTKDKSYGALHKQEARGSLSDLVHAPFPLSKWAQLEQLQVMSPYYSGGTWEQSEAWNCWNFSSDWHSPVCPFSSLGWVVQLQWDQGGSVLHWSGTAVVLHWSGSTMQLQAPSSCQLTLLSLVDHQTEVDISCQFFCLCIEAMTLSISCN